MNGAPGKLAAPRSGVSCTSAVVAGKPSRLQSINSDSTDIDYSSREDSGPESASSSGFCSGGVVSLAPQLPHGSSQWDAALPSPWTTGYSDEGHLYYYNCATGESSWYPPSGYVSSDSDGSASNLLDTPASQHDAMTRCGFRLVDLGDGTPPYYYSDATGDWYYSAASADAYWPPSTPSRVGSVAHGAVDTPTTWGSGDTRGAGANPYRMRRQHRSRGFTKDVQLDAYRLYEPVVDPVPRGYGSDTDSDDDKCAGTSSESEADEAEVLEYLDKIDGAVVGLSFRERLIWTKRAAKRVTGSVLTNASGIAAGAYLGASSCVHLE